MKEPLSKQFLTWMQVSTDDQEKLQKDFEERLKHIVKPCWELKFCPYGPLVEDFPLPPLLIDDHKEHNEYLMKCIEVGKMGENHDIPLDDERRMFFEKELEEDIIEDCVKKHSKFEKEASCREFGHLCPAYFVSESATETSEVRNRGRNISNATIIRVTRRDNNTCQVCGKILLDREIEIDHIIPYSRGGSSDEHNLRVTCLQCNRKKGKKIDL
ncbi:MAG: HNH endonuclease [Lachnospiraceae bacterium]